MQTVPERDARDILTRLRSGTDAETLLSNISNGDLLLQLSVAPESRFRYDFPYGKRMPASLLTQDNAYFDAPLYDPEGVFSSVIHPDMPRENETLPQSSNPSDLPNGTKGVVYTKPFHAAEVIHPRLSNADISAWTTVCEDNVLMRKVLLRWLQCEYHFTAAVQLDLFLEDMITLREDFCSSLLVNVMLGYACVRYTTPPRRSHI